MVLNLPDDSIWAYFQKPNQQGINFLMVSNSFKGCIWNFWCQGGYLRGWLGGIGGYQLFFDGIIIFTVVFIFVVLLFLHTISVSR